MRDAESATATRQKRKTCFGCFQLTEAVVPYKKFSRLLD